MYYQLWKRIYYLKDAKPTDLLHVNSINQLIGGIYEYPPTVCILSYITLIQILLTTLLILNIEIVTIRKVHALLDDFCIQRTSAYISQTNNHIAELTVNLT